VLKLSLKDLLKRALMVDAQEVRLIPGRRTVVVTSQGENEVRGDPQTPDRINALLEEVLTAEARRSLATGWAEWDFLLPDKGRVRATAELKMGLVHAAFDLTRLDEPAPFDELPLPQAAPTPPNAVPPNRAAPHAAAPHLGIPPAALDPDPLPSPDLAQPDPPRARPTVASARMPEPSELAVRIDEQAQSTPARPSHGGAIAMPARGFDAAPGAESTEKIDSLLRQMVAMKASDLHVCATAPPMVRLDGDMVALPGAPPLGPDDVRALLWPMVPPRNRQEFEETHDTDFAHEIPGVARFRANLFVDLRGMGGVFRVIPSKILTAQDLGLSPQILSLCNLSKGLVVVTGPTGSGKSTTLAALIDYINQTRAAHIITIEDPVEFVHPNKKSLINQRQVGEHTHSFKKALRAALREDPDIVLLGEMRDLETISIAMETAETGHLVFGTLHTSSAPSTIDRIIDQFPSEEQNQVRTMLSGSLKGVIAQMLCKKRGGGRVAALEVMFGVPAIANLIREGKIFQIPSVMQTSRNMGMRLMNDSLLELVKSGQVEPDEALSKSTDKSTLQTLFRQNNISFSATA